MVDPGVLVVKLPVTNPCCASALPASTDTAATIASRFLMVIGLALREAARNPGVHKNLTADNADGADIGTVATRPHSDCRANRVVSG